jgi:hypothetical protein
MPVEEQTFSVPLPSNLFLTVFPFHYHLIHKPANRNQCLWLKKDRRKMKEGILEKMA